MVNRKSLLTLTFSLLAVMAHADGEDRSAAGTQWVDPVAFYDLMDIEGSDFQPDYDEGNIDVVSVMIKKGVKVYGLKLKPIAAAGHVEGVHPLGELDDIDYVFSFPYKDIMGIRGVPLNEPSFCVYTDQSVSRSYPCNYTYTQTLTFHYYGYEAPSTTTENIRIEMTFNLSDMRLVAAEDGLGISYGMTASGRYEEARYFNKSDGQPVRASKPVGVDIGLGHFIYKTGSQHLLFILSANERDLLDIALQYVDDTKPVTSEQSRYLDRPWARVYFEVEEMLVDYDGGALLSEEERQEMINYLDGLTAWLSGEGDPFGFGEHTDAKTSAVINTIGTLAAILLGNGLVGIFGGSASGMVESFLEGATGGTPPGSDTPDLKGLEGRKPEEEEDNDNDSPPPPPEQKLDFLDQFSHVDSDGDLIVRDPVTGKETIYINNGDGTYRNFNTDQDWTPEEINDQLRYRDENSGPLKQDAETAAKNAAEQHAQWEKESKELSQDGKDYLDWKHKQEEAIRKEEQIQKLAQKYGVPPTEKAVKNAIKYEQAIAQIDHDVNMDLADQYEKGIEKLKIIDKTCDVTINIMSTCVPGGEAVKNAYNFAKSTLVAASEAINEGKSLGEGIAHVAVGMGNGALGYIQSQAGDLAGKGNWGRELGINVLTEDLKEGMNAYYQTGDLSKARDAMLNATGKKVAEFGITKGISGITGAIQKSAKNSLEGKGIMSEGLAKKMDYWFNKTHVGHIGSRAEMYKVKVSPTGNLSFGKGDGFSVFYSGAIDTAKLTEGVIGETLSNVDAYDWGGRIVQGANDLGVAGAANVMYGAGKLADALGPPEFATVAAPQEQFNNVKEFASKVKDFSDLAASFRKTQ